MTAETETDHSSDSDPLDQRDASPVPPTPEPDSRDVRALTEPMVVLENAGLVAGADDLFIVETTETTYLVDTREGVCACPDSLYRGTECKHLRRVRHEIGERPIPATVANGGRERPVDCACADLSDLLCWPCAREGFETQNPATDDYIHETETNE